MDTTEKTVLNVEGMTCSNCALGISKYLQKQGLQDVNVDFSSGEVEFEAIEKNKIPELIKGINKLGYHVVNTSLSGEKEGTRRFFTTEKKFFISLFFTLPLFLHMFLPFHLLHDPWFQLMLATPVYLIGVFHFGRSAWASLKTGIPNMDVLIFIGSSAAFFYSLTGTILYAGTDAVNNFLFYETAAVIITLVLLGNLLEQKSVARTTSAVEDLAKLQPLIAKRINANGEIEEIEFDKVNKGDVLLVNHGDKVPVDGKIISGEVRIDESMITGESIPVEKSKDDSVIGGTVLLDGNMRIKATSVGSETVLSNIIKMVKDAQKNKPKIQQTGDKVSAIFVPVVVGISLLTFLGAYLIFNLEFSQALMNSIAVLVVSCPCAMGLATPTAVVVGIGRAAKNGILIKGGSTLEILAGVKTFVFDKTGTLTTGKFRIKNFESYSIEKDEAQKIIYELEKHSSHPIAKSIVESWTNNYKQNGVHLINIKEEKGVGMSAVDDKGNKYKFGAAKNKENKHDLYLLKNEEVVAGLDIEDDIKKDAPALIKYLKANGIKTILLSGDRKEACSAVADQLGMDEYYCEKKPEEKLKIISGLTANGLTAMVGDGINDAPSLSQASTGISLGNATQVAIQSAQVIVMNDDDLSQIMKAYQISKLSLQTIKQNLFWAFFYNILTIPLAAIGLLSPMIAAFSMAFSDVIVVGNSLRLKARKIK